MRKWAILGLSLVTGLVMIIAQATTAWASPPLMIYQPTVPKALKKI